MAGIDSILRLVNLAHRVSGVSAAAFDAGLADALSVAIDTAKKLRLGQRKTPLAEQQVHKIVAYIESVVDDPTDRHFLLSRHNANFREPAPDRPINSEIVRVAEVAMSELNVDQNMCEKALNLYSGKYLGLRVDQSITSNKSLVVVSEMRIRGHFGKPVFISGRHRQDQTRLVTGFLIPTEKGLCLFGRDTRSKQIWSGNLVSTGGRGSTIVGVLCGTSENLDTPFASRYLLHNVAHLGESQSDIARLTGVYSWESFENLFSSVIPNFDLVKAFINAESPLPALFPVLDWKNIAEVTPDVPRDG